VVLGKQLLEEFVFFIEPLLDSGHLRGKLRNYPPE
jgi:hypothetical protein